MVDDLLDLLELLFRNEGLAKLLQVHGRAVIRSDRPDFIARKNVIENFVLLEAVEKLRQQARARRRLRLRSGADVEQPLRIFRLVQVFTELPGMILHKEVELLPSCVDLRSQLLQPAFLMLETILKVIQGRLQVGRVTRI